jgi:hypothetical protein
LGVRAGERDSTQRAVGDDAAGLPAEAAAQFDVVARPEHDARADHEHRTGRTSDIDVIVEDVAYVMVGPGVGGGDRTAGDLDAAVLLGHVDGVARADRAHPVAADPDREAGAGAEPGWWS